MDLEFLSGAFDRVTLPKEKQYLYRYFRCPLQSAFIRYTHVFKDWKLFREHTGMTCSSRYFQQLSKKQRLIEEAHAAAKSSMDFDTLSEIERGKYKP